MKVLFVHKRDEDGETDEMYAAWQVWIPSDFQEYWDDNKPTAHGETKEEAIANLREELAVVRARWPDSITASEEITELSVEDIELGDLSVVPLWQVESRSRLQDWTPVPGTVTADYRDAADEARYRRLIDLPSYRGYEYRVQQIREAGGASAE